MLNTLIGYGLPLAFTILVTCALASIISGLALFMFKLRKTNEIMQHPYLKHQPFDRYPFSIQAAILLDYFFRISFPRSRFWLIGNANQLLRDVHPNDIPTTIKWPLVGLWGGVFIGLIAMAFLWGFLLLSM